MPNKLSDPCNAQIKMPGIPNPLVTSVMTTYNNMAVGQEVIYLGKINGGPRYRTGGVIRRVLPHRAIVDMDGLGNWQIPYYFLSLREVA